MWFGGRTYRVPARTIRTVNCRMSREGGYFLYHHTRDTGGSPVDWCPYKEPLSDLIMHRLPCKLRMHPHNNIIIFIYNIFLLLILLLLLLL
jgi:hypothetical protein